jgi:transporter family-2 protein
MIRQDYPLRERIWTSYLKRGSHIGAKCCAFPQAHAPMLIRSDVMENIFVPLALAAGALLAVQAGANAQLARATGSSFAATALQLSVGTIILLVLAGMTGGLLALYGLPRAPWWHLIGGVASAFYVVSTTLLFPRLGAVVSVGLLIAGQMLVSVTIDGLGLLGVAARPLSLTMIAGNAAVLAGAALIVFGQRDALKQLDASKLGWIGLAVMAGALLPIQGAINGLLHRDIGAPMAVGATSFFVATLSMGVVLLIAVSLQRAPRPQLSGVSAMPWWGWLGGFAGATYVMTVFTAIPVIGTAAALGLTVAGQQVAGIFVDLYGWFRLPQRPVSAVRLFGVGLLLGGVALMKLL